MFSPEKQSNRIKVESESYGSCSFDLRKKETDWNLDLPQYGSEKQIFFGLKPLNTVDFIKTRIVLHLLYFA